MGQRGELTKEVQKIAKEHFGREITLRELRLMPYVQYQMMNEQKIEPNRINAEERQVLSIWRKEGHIEGGASGLYITKEFWDTINQILFSAYVDCER
mgnify:CR=1 FL=1